MQAFGQKYFYFLPLVAISIAFCFTFKPTKDTSASMKTFLSLLIICCAFASTKAQVNFVKNGDFERYDTCPYQIDQLTLAKFWHPPFDSAFAYPGEYNNACANVDWDHSCHVPENTAFYQNAHSGDGLVGLTLYYDKTSPPPPVEAPFNFRDYAQVRLYKNLSASKSYCVSFWVVKTESYCYAHNKIGAYLDNGAINSAVDSAGKEITSVVPQVFTNSIIKDTMNWTKIEGSFVAKGTESMITIGNFSPNSAVDTSFSNCSPGGSFQYSYYLIDDVSVVAIDAKANAGVDRWVELGKKTQIGPVEDSTARGMDCKWYHKGVLIDSGNVISVNASSIKYAVDTYVVVQNVCGNITRDTMLLRTVGLGMSPSPSESAGERFSIYPNPSTGAFTIASSRGTKQSETIKVYNFLAQVIYEGKLKDKKTTIQLNAASGVYIVEVTDENQNRWRERVVVE